MGCICGKNEEQQSGISGSKTNLKNKGLLQDYKESFKLFDKDNDGTISVAEIMDTFHEMNLPLTKAEALDLMQEYDVNSDGSIDFDEFVSFMKRYLNAQESGASAMFQYFDIDGDGCITTDEFVLTMRFLGEELSMSDADRILNKYYKDGEKKITKENFNDIMKKYL